jgi:hypothetical protein
MYRAIRIVAAVCVLGPLACEDPITPVISPPPVLPSDSLTFGFGGLVDIHSGIRYYRNVHVEGTLTYFLTFSDTSNTTGELTSPRTVGVFLFAKMSFRRDHDYQGVSQDWHAGGKSYEDLPIADDGRAMTLRLYQLMGIENTAFINIEFLVQNSKVYINSIWVTYEFPP